MRRRRIHVYLLLISVTVPLLGVAIVAHWVETSRDDPALRFSADIYQHYPELAVSHPSADRFYELFGAIQTANLFDPWMADFDAAWSDAIRTARRERVPFDPAVIDVTDYWLKAQPIIDEIGLLMQHGEFNIHAISGSHPFDNVLSYTRLIGVTRLIIVKELQEESGVGHHTGILTLWVRILGQINSHGIDLMDYRLSLGPLKMLWEAFPQTILADPEMRKTYREFAENWPERLNRAILMEVVSLAWLFNRMDDKGHTLADRFLLSFVASPDTWASQLPPDLGRTYARFILYQRTLPNRTLNRLWEIEQSRSDLLRQGSFNDLDLIIPGLLEERSQSSLFDSNKGGKMIIAMALPSLSGTVAVSNDLSNEILSALKTD